MKYNKCDINKGWILVSAVRISLESEFYDKGCLIWGSKMENNDLYLKFDNGQLFEVKPQKEIRLKKEEIFYILHLPRNHKLY